MFQKIRVHNILPLESSQNIQTMTPLSCKYNKVAVGKYIELFQPSLVSQNNFYLNLLYR